MTIVKKVSQRGLVAAAIMVPLILVFYSMADAAPEIVRIPCGNDIDATINDPKLSSTPQRFVLDPCTYQVSTTMRPQNGDEIACKPGVVLKRPLRGTYPSNLTTKIVASGSLSVIAKPQGHFYSEWCDWSGAHFTGSSGSGVAIAGGQMAPTSLIYASHIHHNEGAGMTNFPGTARDVEADFNGSAGSTGFIASGIKGTMFFEVAGGYFHDNSGNGVWCDSGCDPSSFHANGFYVHDAELSNNGGAGARYENAPTKALIANNHVWGNSKTVNRAGITLRDAQNATVQGNVFAGSGYAHNQSPDNIAIRADSSGRVATKNIRIVSNALGGEKIKTCGGPVICQNNQ